MKHDGKYIVIICCFIVYAVGTESTDVGCKVSYNGIVYLSIHLPKGHNKWNYLQPSFYYKNKGNDGAWKEEPDCNFINRKKLFKCAMHELTKKERSLMEKINGYEFKLSILVNETLTNLTDLNFAKNKNVTLAPWQTVNQITYCENSYGVKYMASNASFNSISVEWIRFPLDVDYSINFESHIVIKSSSVDRKDYIDKSKYCHHDFCKYDIPSLTPCTQYDICLKTFNNLKTKNQKKCRSIRTYCDNNKKKSVKWQDTLLCVFGAIILIMCVVMLWALFNKHMQFGAMFNNMSSQNEIVNQEDLVTPTISMLNGNSMHQDFHDTNTSHIYHYPYSLVTTHSDQ